MIEIIPAILPLNSRDLKEKISALPVKATLVHLDILEEDIWTETNRDLEVHIMAIDPREFVDKWAERGAKRIIVHSLYPQILALKGELEIGLGVEMDIPIDEIFSLIPQVNFVHLMSIAEIGEQGHPLDSKIFDRIKVVREKFPDLVISVDGGINTSNMTELMEAGANRLVVGSSFSEVWNSLTNG